MTNRNLWTTILKVASMQLLVLLNGFFVAQSLLIGRPTKQAAGASTVSELIIQKLGRFARPGDVLTIDGSELRVEEIAGTRIAKIKLTRRHETVGTVSRDIGLLTRPADLRQPEPVMAGHNHSHLEHAA